jgi:hypothetical protein
MLKPGPQPRGRCAVCGGMFALRKDGGPREHTSIVDGSRCVGSSRPAKDVEPPRSGVADRAARESGA